eukprot:s92_g13.t1
MALKTYFVKCLQEVTPSCVEDLLQVACPHGYEVATAMGRGSVSTEPFDVCMLLNGATICKLRLSISPLTSESPRRLLAVQVQLHGNGAVFAVGTVHLTAGPDCQTQRSAELKSALSTLAALPVDGHLLLGDLNMRKDEDVTISFGRGTMHGIAQAGIQDFQTDARVEQWRFDRVLFRSQDSWRQPEAEGEEAVRIGTVKLCDNSFAVDFDAAPSDHAFVQASFTVLARPMTERKIFEERLQLLRPGLGPHVGARAQRKSAASSARGNWFAAKSLPP